MTSDPGEPAPTPAAPARFGVLFVCLGNICRSPTAEGVFRRDVARAGLGDVVRIDSAGTGAWHVGHPPDARSQAAALRRGVDLSGQRARQVSRGDFLEFDLIVPMDRSNSARLEQLRPSLVAGERRLAEVRLMLAFSERLVAAGIDEVPDPYDGGPEGFDRVFDLIEEASAGLLARLRSRIVESSGGSGR